MDKADGLALRVSRFINKVTRVVSRILQILNSGDIAAASTEYMTLWTTLTTAERRLSHWIDLQPALDHEFVPQFCPADLASGPSHQDRTIWRSLQKACLKDAMPRSGLAFCMDCLSAQ